MAVTLSAAPSRLVAFRVRGGEWVRSLETSGCSSPGVCMSSLFKACDGVNMFPSMSSVEKSSPEICWLVGGGRGGEWSR